MKVTNILVCIFLLLGSSKSFGATATRTSLSGDIAPGNEVVMGIELNSDEEISGLQVNIEEFSSFGVFVEGESEVLGRASAHSLTTGVREDGTGVILIYSHNMASISAGYGSIAFVKVKLTKKSFTKSVNISAIASDSNGNKLEIGVSPLEVNIEAPNTEYLNGSIYNLGRVPLLSTKRLEIPIYNSGAAQLEISSIDFSKSGFEALNKFPITVQPGDSYFLKFQMLALERGPFSATAKIRSNDPEETVLHILGESYAVNELHIGDVSGIYEDIIEIPLTLNNIDSITGFTFEFELPDELQYVEDSFRLSERKADHQVSVNIIDKKLHATAFSLTDAPFNDNGGKIASFQVQILGSSSHLISASKAVLSADINGNVENVISHTYPGKITVKYPQIYVSKQMFMGRTPITESISTGFSVRNTGTAVLRIDRIITKDLNVEISGTFPITIQPGYQSYRTINLNSLEEGEIDGYILVYTNDPENPVSTIKVSGERYAPNYITATASSYINDIEEGCITINLSNYNSIQALQFDLKIPEDTQLSNMSFSDRALGYTSEIRLIDASTARIFCYALSGNEIPSGDGEIARINFGLPSISSGSDVKFSISNIKLADNQLMNRYSGAQQVEFLCDRNETTGLQNIEYMKEKSVEYFDLNGIRIFHPQSGRVYICRKGNSVEKIIY